jgi:hypothetical protein
MVPQPCFSSSEPLPPEALKVCFARTLLRLRVELEAKTVGVSLGTCSPRMLDDPQGILLTLLI